MLESDWTVLGFVSACRLVTGKQLVARFWTADPERDPAKARAGRRALKRLSGQRILEPLPGRSRGGVRGGSSTIIYRVGAAGAKLLARRGFHQRRLGAPGAHFTLHTLACTQIAVDLHVAHARGALDLIEVQGEPACHRGFVGMMGARQVLKPDLFVRVGAGALEDRWFIECDLSTEHATTLLAKSKRYLAYHRSGAEQREHGTFPRVLWAVPDDHRARQVTQMTGKLPVPMQPMFAVCLLGGVAECLGREARS